MSRIVFLVAPTDVESQAFEVFAAGLSCKPCGVLRNIDPATAADAQAQRSSFGDKRG